MLYRDYYPFMRLQQELLLDLNEEMIQSSEPIVRQLLKTITPQEYYHHVKMHIEVFANTLYFQDETLLHRYLEWRYRVYYYRGIDIDFLLYENQCFKELIGFYLDKITYLSISTLNNDIERLHQQIIEKIKNPQKIEDSDTVMQLYNHVIKGEEGLLNKLIEQKSTTLEEFCNFFDNYLSPLIQRVGREWEYNRLSIAQEHLITNILTGAIEKFFQHFSSSQKHNGIKVIMATAPNEYHGLGLKIANYLLEQLGYEVINLGVNLPTQELQDSIIEIKPDYLVTSITLITQLKSMNEIIKELNQSMDYKMTTIVSGNALKFLESPCKSLLFDKIIYSFSEFYEQFKITKK